MPLCQVLPYQFRHLCVILKLVCRRVMDLVGTAGHADRRHQTTADVEHPHGLPELALRLLLQLHQMLRRIYCGVLHLMIL